MNLDGDLLASVLIVEDEAKYRRLIIANLRMAGCTVREAASGHEAVQALYEHEPDVILLDLRLPDVDGIVLCQRLRSLTQAPILVLTALDTEQALVESLEAGADDYISKPFSPTELLARLRALLRRGRSQPEVDRPGCGDVRLDPKGRRLIARDRVTHLTPTELRLAAVFVAHCGKVVTHEYLLTRVWGAGYTEEREYLRVYIRRLRQYIEPDPKRPVYLISHLGVGYALYPQPHGQAAAPSLDRS